MDPLEIPCPRCAVRAGEKCIDFRGRAKQTCRQRWDDRLKPAKEERPTSKRALLTAAAELRAAAARMERLAQECDT
jgi:hypothetical protein